jgi:hypothetical protein
MRLLRFRQEAHHRGYRIEGQQLGEGWILRVIATGPGLPRLPYWRYRMIRGSWTKAAVDIARHIDSALAKSSLVIATPDRTGGETVRRLLADIQALRERLKAEDQPKPPVADSTMPPLQERSVTEG